MMTIKPTVEIRPPWSPSSLFDMYNNLTLEEEDDFDELDDSLVGLDSPSAGLDAYSSCDEFRMYEFKIRRCARGRSHDWTECPYAHPGEKARRRDPRKYHYSGTACPDFRRGNCKRGDGCDMAHGVFECWLHPARYRTQPCKDGTNCTRRVCFFAHTPEQLRVLPQSPKTPVLESYDGSPMRRRRSRVVVVEEEEEEMKVLQMMRRLQLGRVERFGGFCSLPTTTTTSVMSMTAPMSRMGLNEGVEVERVESGRELRLKMYERLSKESGVGRGLVPDVGWVSELVK